MSAIALATAETNGMLNPSKYIFLAKVRKNDERNSA